MEINLIKTGDKIISRLEFKMTEPELGAWPEDGSKFMVAPELKEIGVQLIKRFRSDLANVNIGYVFKKKASCSGDIVTMGQARSENELHKILHGFDAIIIIGFDAWIQLDKDGKFRLVYHELQHIARDLEKDTIGIVSHSVEEFPEVVKVFGPSTNNEVELFVAWEQFKKDWQS